MNIAILGTGSVGQALAEKLISVGHIVIMGTRNVEDTMARKPSGNQDGPSFSDWVLKNHNIVLKTFKEAVYEGELIINALGGGVTLATLQSCEQEDFDHKIIMDISNPLDFSKGFPPTLLSGLNNTYSLGEAIQKELPNAKVVKTLNTMWSGLMVNPKMIADGHHQNFICGNDNDAKAKVIDILTSFGWERDYILDLGDITNARGTEAILLLWIRIYGATQSGAFNFKIVK